MVENDYSTVVDFPFDFLGLGPPPGELGRVFGGVVENPVSDLLEGFDIEGDDDSTRPVTGEIFKDQHLLIAVNLGEDARFWSNIPLNSPMDVRTEHVG